MLGTCLFIKLLRLDHNGLSQQIVSATRAHLLAWRDTAMSASVWAAPPEGFLKVAIRNGCAIAAAVLSDSSGNIIAAVTQKKNIFKRMFMWVKLLQPLWQSV